MEADSAQIYSAKQRADLYVWLGWIGSMLNLENAKEDEICIPNSEDGSYYRNRLLATVRS